MVAATVLFVGNTALAAGVVALRTNQSFSTVVVGDFRDTAFNNVAMGPLGWLMGLVYTIQWWATMLFALPLYTTRMASQRFVEMRDMFTQTIGALAAAVDKRDPFTARHSERVKQIAVDIGAVMHVSDYELEALEWGGLLHDVGKIGVPDDVLKKAERLTREERMVMNAHPVLGAEIIAPVTKLAAELPIIRHHHEWYNGSGYPDRLIGDEIPKLARILHVADAFEAMTAARPYRMTPLSARGGARRAAQVRRRPVRSRSRRCLRQDRLGRGCPRRGPAERAAPDPAACPGGGRAGRGRASRRQRRVRLRERDQGRAGLTFSPGRAHAGDSRPASWRREPRSRRR